MFQSCAEKIRELCENMLYFNHQIHNLCIHRFLQLQPRRALAAMPTAHPALLRNVFARLDPLKSSPLSLRLGGNMLRSTERRPDVDHGHQGEQAVELEPSPKSLRRAN